MKDIYLTNYSVKGIKTLDKTVSLSFYKKTINKEPDTQEYNIKGIYGMNGSGNAEPFRRNCQQESRETFAGSRVYGKEWWRVASLSV